MCACEEYKRKDKIMVKRIDNADNGLTATTAKVLYGDFKTTDKKELRKAVEAELTRLISTGEISKKEAKAALKFLDNDLAGALARRNTVEGTLYETLYGFEDLKDKQADTLMKESGLTIGDLYEASKFAGEDYEVNYVKLTKKEKKAAKNGELTRSELSNIQNALNAKIKANGGGKELNENETKQLMTALGLSIENKNGVIDIIKKIDPSLGGTLLNFLIKPRKINETKAAGSAHENSEAAAGQGSVENPLEQKMAILGERYTAAYSKEQNDMK